MLIIAVKCLTYIILLKFISLAWNYDMQHFIPRASQNICRSTARIKLSVKMWEYKVVRRWTYATELSREAWFPQETKGQQLFSSRYRPYPWKPDTWKSSLCINTSVVIYICARSISFQKSTAESLQDNKAKTHRNQALGMTMAGLTLCQISKNQKSPWMQSYHNLSPPLAGKATLVPLRSWWACK